MTTFTVLVETRKDRFSASLAGAPQVRVVRPTRTQAIDALKTEIEHRIVSGELLSLDIDIVSVASLAGKYSDDPTLDEICNDVYRERDIEQ